MSERHWVLPIIITSDIGYTAKAMEIKRQRGIWLEGSHWKKAPDGKIVYNFPAIQEWLSGETHAA
jgi:Putative excisionase (DUF1233)